MREENTRKIEKEERKEKKKIIAKKWKEQGY